MVRSTSVKPTLSGPSQREKELTELGFIPLCHCSDTDLAAFFSNMSLQRPATYDRTAATANARISAMLQYVLCVSRFAHYLKVIARDRVGTFIDPAACEDYLHNWLLTYTMVARNVSIGTLAGSAVRTERISAVSHRRCRTRPRRVR